MALECKQEQGTRKTYAPPRYSMIGFELNETKYSTVSLHWTCSALLSHCCSQYQSNASPWFCFSTVSGATSATASALAAVTLHANAICVQHASHGFPLNTSSQRHTVYYFINLSSHGHKSSHCHVGCISSQCLYRLNSIPSPRWCHTIIIACLHSKMNLNRRRKHIVWLCSAVTTKSHTTSAASNTEIGALAAI
jgi:hypothetical protein